jgi:hypothetical protein
VRPKAALNKYYNLLITVVKRMPFHTLFRFVDKQKAVNNFKKDPFYDESSEYCIGDPHVVSKRSRIQHFRSMRVRIQGFDEQN